MFKVLEMRHRFQADICGWLEQESKQPTLHSKIFQLKKLSIGDHDSPPTALLESLTLTLSYYNNSTEALETLHNTVFQAIQKNNDYQTDFDAPSFEIGIDHRLLHHIAERFNLHKYTYIELWKIPTSDALNFIYTTFRQTMKPLRYFHKMFIKLVQRDDQPMGEQCWRWEWWLSFQFQIDSRDNCVMDHFECLLEVFYDCMYENYSISKKNPILFWKMKSSTKRLFSALQDLFITLLERCTLHHKRGLAIESVMLLRMTFNMAGKDSSSLPDYLRGFIDDIIPTESNVSFPVKTCQDTRKEEHSLEYDWNQLSHTNDDGTLTLHEKTFMVICSHMQGRSLASMQLGQLEFAKIAFHELEELIRRNIVEQKSDRTNYLECKLWCCYVIRNRTSYWLSVLKVVIQFTDLWINDLLESNSAEMFAILIAQEDMAPVLYTHIKKHVQQFDLTEDKVNFIKIQNLCLLLEKSIERFDSIEKLLEFRDLVFIQRDPVENIRSPIFQTATLWNIPFESELLKVSNQITTADDIDDEVPDDIVQKLIFLSVIWPFEVLHVLLKSSFQNKNQYKAIIPILTKLGNLCALGKTITCRESLLLHAFKYTIYSMNADAVEACQDNIVHFIKACCHLEFHQKYPLILTPNSSTQQYAVLLTFQDIMNEFILPNLESFSLLHEKLELNNQEDTSGDATEFIETRLLRLSLYILNTFCEFPASNNQKIECDSNTINAAFSNTSDVPAVLYMSPEEFAQHLTIILALRNGNDKHNNTHGLRLQDWELVINYLDIFTTVLEYGLTMRPENFVKVFQFFDTILTEYDWESQLLWYQFTRTMTQKPFKIPYAFFQITGELGGLLVGDQEKEEELISLVDNNNQLSGWCDLFNACKLSETIRNVLFEHAYQWEYNLILLWTHPFEGEIIKNCFRQVLHPSNSFSVSIEYSKLLQCFLSQLYDTFGCHHVIRNYEKYDVQDQIIPIIRRLSKQGTRIYFSVLYTTQLLKYQSSCPKEEENTKYDNYYVASLTKVLQNLTRWGNISKSGQIRNYNELRKLLRVSDTLQLEDQQPTEPFLPENESSREESISGNASTSTKTTIVARTGPQIIYYPLLNTEELISDRALSILTLFHLCSLSVQFKDKNEIQRDAITRLILQVAEGLIDTDSRLDFQRMLQQQPKSRIINWKKKSKTHGGKIMKMRPVITLDEEVLLRPSINCMHNADEILQALGMAQSQNNSNNNDSQALYFI